MFSESVRGVWCFASNAHGEIMVKSCLRLDLPARICKLIYLYDLSIWFILVLPILEASGIRLLPKTRHPNPRDSSDYLERLKTLAVLCGFALESQEWSLHYTSSASARDLQTQGEGFQKLLFQSLAMLVLQVLLAMYFLRPFPGWTLCRAVATAAPGPVHCRSQQED